MMIIFESVYSWFKHQLKWLQFVAYAQGSADYDYVVFYVLNLKLHWIPFLEKCREFNIIVKRRLQQNVYTSMESGSHGTI